MKASNSFEDRSSYLEAEILSPVFIGAGDTWQQNLDWLYDSQSKKVVLLDEEKLFQIIGEKNIERWVAYISSNRKKPLLEFLRGFRPRCEVADLAKETKELLSYDWQPEREIHRLVRSGNGRALLPGSSLKGALRTAYFVHLLSENKELATNSSIIKDRKLKFKDNGLSCRLFWGGGEKPTMNFDLFRLVQLGDLSFEHSGIGVCQVISRNAEGYWDDRKDLSNFYEYLAPGQKAFTRLKVRSELAQAAAGQFRNAEALNARAILQKAHEHSLRSLSKELALAEEKGDSLPRKAAGWLASLRSFKEQALAMGENQALIRVGAGTSFLGTTGGWQADYWSETDMRKLAFQSRHGRNKNDKLPFPRSRKLGPEGVPLGFVKLSLVEQSDYEAGMKRQREKLETKLEANEAAALEREEPQVLAPEFRTKTGKIKAGDLLDAVVKQGKRKPYRATIYLNEGETTEVDLSGVVNPSEGQIIIVEVNNANKKGKVMGVRFLRLKT